MNVVRSFASIVDRQTVAVLVASQVATFACVRAGWAIQLPEGLIAIAIVFPLGFAINAAYSRREKALESYAALKGFAMAAFLAHRDWLVVSRPDLLERVRTHTAGLLAAMARVLTSGGTGSECLAEVHARASELSAMADALRGAGVGAGDASRPNQYISNLLVEFEKVRNVKAYRTPASLRAYADVFLNALPVLFAPHFAYLSVRVAPVIGFAVAAIYAVILVSLDNIQDALEDPFDGLGEDDVRLDAAAEYMAATEVFMEARRPEVAVLAS